MADEGREDNRRIENLINGYRLIQSDLHCRLGMDTVMLSAFLSPSKTESICDLGSGIGAVSILLAARYPKARIDGVEILPAAASLFQENILLNRLEDRVRSFNADLRKLDDILPADSYTAVVSNPPYFELSRGKPSASQEKRIERSEAEADFDDICSASARLLKDGGELAVVCRTERLSDIIASMRQTGIEPKRLKFIHHTMRTSSKLMLISGRKHANAGMQIEPPLIIRLEDGAFSNEYLRTYSGEHI